MIFDSIKGQEVIDVAIARVRQSGAEGLSTLAPRPPTRCSMVISGAKIN
jgi:hypothetical protein